MKQTAYQMDKFYALIDFIPLPILVFQMPNITFNYVPHTTHYVNKKFTEVMGYKKEEIPDHKIWLQLAFPDSDSRQNIIQQWENNIIKPENKVGGYLVSTVEIMCKNNQTRWFKIYTELRRKIYTGLYIVTFCDQTMEMENINLKKMCISTDSLTKVANKQFILRSIDDEAARVNRFGEPFSIIIAHIDNLMSIDESYGQDAVEYILKTLAEILRTTIRKIDLISRWDNDEFLILIPKTHAEQAYKINQSILDNINNFPFLFNDNSLNVSVTSGISEYHINESVSSTIERADSALYLAKTRGKGYIINPEIENNYPKKSRFDSKL
jgi:diguanylate cyclase (GGDEF)-like protein